MEKKKNESPYNLADIKYLHPYYLFSLPIIDQYVKKTNNKIFSIDEMDLETIPITINLKEILFY